MYVCRSLKLWFVFRRFGQQKLLSHLQQGLDLSAYFASLLAAYPDLFELACPVSLSLVCFRLKGHGNGDQTHLLEIIKATGECFIIHTKLGDKVVMRFACGGMEQTKNDVFQGFSVILRETTKFVTVK
jgi:glutamate/tyrosine decarboxylase-like PLP-dependent enzyme